MATRGAHVMWLRGFPVHRLPPAQCCLAPVGLLATWPSALHSSSTGLFAAPENHASSSPPLPSAGPSCSLSLRSLRTQPGFLVRLSPLPPSVSFFSPQPPLLSSQALPPVFHSTIIFFIVRVPAVLSSLGRVSAFSTAMSPGPGAQLGLLNMH